MSISDTGSYTRKDQLFPASRDGTATYVDHDESGRQVLRTEVKHLRGEIPMDPKDISNMRQFNSRDEMLFYIANERLKYNYNAYNRGEISLSERYQGFDDGLVKGITRPVRIFMPKQNGAIKGLLEGIDTLSDKITLSKETQKKLGLSGKALNVPLKVYSIAIKVTNFALKALDLTARTLWAGGRAVKFLATDVRKQGWEKAVDEKFIKWDRKLLKNPKTYAWVNYSVKDVRDFIVRPQIKAIKDHSKTYTKSTWHHNGESNYSFTNENGEKEVLKNTVVSSNDRTAKKISMMRCVDDITTGESISYTGRADTSSKIEEQLNFLFQSELSKKKEHQKGLKKTESGYDLTFMVNNLMSSNAFGTMGLTGLTGLDERASIKREVELFMSFAKNGMKLKDKDGNVHNVNITPLYFNQGFNYLATTYGTPETQKEINKKGYEQLLPMIQAAIDDNNKKLSSEDRNLLRACYSHLQNRRSLGPEVELFYRDLSMKLLKIPVINHCKSSIDRTTLALAIATSTQSWINLGKKISTNNPHEIMSDTLYKELFIANVQGSHQATRVSRATEGEIGGHQQFSRALGFEWGSKKKGLKGKVVSLFQGQNPIALRLLPDRYLDKSKKNFNEESTLIKDRFLKKPKKMKMFYTNDNPHIVKLQEDLRREAKERQELRTQRVFKSLENQPEYSRLNPEDECRQRAEKELKQLLGQENPKLRAIENLLQTVSVNNPLTGDPIGSTPLHYLAKRGRAVAVVPMLANKGANFNLQDNWGNTPLLWAIANGNFSTAKQIIKHAPNGTNFDIMGRGNSALHLALAKGYTNRTRDGALLNVSSIDLMRLLIDRCSVDTHEAGGNTPLHIACVRRDPVMIRELLAARADRSIKNSFGETPVDMLEKTDLEAHEFLKSTARVYLLEKRASIEDCKQKFKESVHL